MTNNPILDTLRATRERLLSESGGTVSSLLKRLRADQATSNHPQFEPSNNKTMNQNRGAGRFRDGESNPATRLS